MKRLFLFATLLVLALLFAYLRWGPIEPVRKISKHLPVEWTSKVRPQILPTVMIETPPPAPISLKYPRPQWENDPVRHGLLVSVATLQSNDLGRHKVNGNRLNYLTTGGDFLAVADLSTKHAVILSPELKIQRKWPMTAGVASMMHAPVSLAASKNKVAALDQDGTLVWWDSEGKRLGSFGIDGIVYDLDFNQNGDFLVHQTKPYPQTMAIYERNGRQKTAFGALPADDEEAAPLLHQGHLAQGSGAQSALVMINPYQIYFFNDSGRPEHALQITPEFQVFEPFAEKLGPGRWRVLRQKVVHDACWHDGQLWVLVAPDAERAASWLEVFSRKGEFLQRFYLPMNAIQLTFWRDDLVLLGFAPLLKLERFRIDRIRR